MLILPIGQKDNIVRRTPWVSFSLIAVNLAVYILVGTGHAMRGGYDEARSKLRDVGAYLVEHPYLQVNVELTERLGPQFEAELKQLREQHEARRRAPEGFVRDNEQSTLDGLARDAIVALRSSPAQRLGFVPREASPIRSLTSMFMHGGWLHLLGNMLFLFLSGPFLEDVYGRPLFAALYLLSGMAALGAHVVKSPDSLVPLVGASGAIAGVMGAFLLRLGKKQIQFLVIPIPILPMFRYKPFLPAFVVLPLWAAEQYWYAQAESDSGVAFWAHLGGFGWGFLAALVVALTGIERRYIHPAIEKETTITQHPALERALDARVSGDLVAARREIRSALAAEPNNLDALEESLEIAFAEGDQAESARCATRLLELYQRKGEPELAARLLADERLSPAQPLTPRYHVAAAMLLERQADARSALAHYQRVIDSAFADPLALKALMRRGEILAKADNPREARKAFERALAHPSCSALRRASVEASLGRLPPTR